MAIPTFVVIVTDKDKNRSERFEYASKEDARRKKDSLIAEKSTRTYAWADAIDARELWDSAIEQYGLEDALEEFMVFTVDVIDIGDN